MRRVSVSNNRLRQPWRWLPFPLRLRWARMRARLVRHRVARRLASIGLGVGLVVWLVVSVVEAREAREQWGAARRVVVAGHELSPGTIVSEADLGYATRPVAATPSDALVAMPSEDDTIVEMLLSGDVVTVRHLQSTRPDSISLPEGLRAVGVPLDAAAPPVSPGDHVDVVLVADPLSGGGDDVLEPSAIVLLATEDTLTLAVPRDHVPRIAATLATGRVAVARR